MSEEIIIRVPKDRKTDEVLQMTVKLKDIHKSKSKKKIYPCDDETSEYYGHRFGEHWMD